MSVASAYSMLVHCLQVAFGISMMITLSLNAHHKRAPYTPKYLFSYMLISFLELHNLNLPLMVLIVHLCCDNEQF